MQDSKFGEHLYLTPRVPQGLAAAVEGLTREVIRHRPENIYDFAARHFENLLRLREQYDDPSSSSKKKSKKQLHQMNEAVRERHDESKDTIDRARQSGWSLNETAKVLEKHRSIFGDSGQKVSTEQIRELANEPTLTSRERLEKDGSPRRKVNRSNGESVECTAGSSRRKECTQEASKSGAARNAPKILSQIPIAKDIKTELKRNRISSRERKKVVACEYTRETIIEKSSKKSSFEKTKRSYSEVRKSSRIEDSSSTKKRTETSTKSRTNSQEEKKFTRAGSMDSVKNYVVQNFVGMTSLNELQSPSYVEKVQEVIDQTSSVIKEKVEALKSGVARAAKTKQMRKEASVSSEDHSKSSNSDKKESSLFRRNDVSEASESKSTLPAVRPLSSKSASSRSISARSDSAAALTLPPISPESAKSPKVKEELVLPILSPPRTGPSLDEALSADDTTAAVEEIAEDATVSSERIVADKLLEENASVAEVVQEESMPSDGSLMQLEETAVDESVTEENSLHAQQKTDETKTEIVAEKTVAEVPQEKLVPPEEVDDGKAVPLTDSKDEKAVSPGEIDDGKEGPLKETNVEKIVLLNETDGDKVSPKEIADEKTEPPVDTQPEKEVAEKNPRAAERTTEEKVLTTEAISNEIIISERQASSDQQIIEKLTTNFLEVNEEEFHDSLNVTPEPFDTKGQRPDSLENTSAEDNNSSGHVSPLETLKDKLLEIKEVQKRIEDVLDDTKTSKSDEATTTGTTTTTTTTTTTGAKIEDKLIEIQESEKRIEQILDSQSPSETSNSDIKNKLQELEEAERRIESIFPKEITKGFSEKTDMLAVEIIEESVVITTGNESKEEGLEASITTTEVLNVPIAETRRTEPSTRAVSPHSYILTEGSPYEIPDSVTTVIIPERTPTPDSETLRVEVEDAKMLSSSLVRSKEHEENPSSKINDVFGEPVETSEQSEPSTLDIEYIRGIKASHDMIVSRENLDGIKEERDEATTTTTTAEVIDSEDEKVLKVVTSSLEEILEKDEVEYVRVQGIANKFIEEEKQQEIVENSLESTTERSVEESTNEIKETSVTTDRSSLSLDQIAPSVPELNLDSLADLTISSFNINSSTPDTTGNEKALKKEEENSLLDIADSETETQEFEKLEERLTQQLTAASDIGLPEGEEQEARDINNIVCSAKDSENNLPEAAAAAAAAESQCTIETTGLIDTNKCQSMLADHDENDDDDHADEKKSYHIYVPEANSSKDVSSSSETSTFMSAATKIQAGVRGFLTRRRLQSTQKRSSTLDSVPSIQESFTVETTSALLPIVESTISISEAKSRKKLRREDAVQRTTLSVENAFAENQLQHTGEFHDCIPLPVFDAKALSLKSVKEREIEKSKQKANEVEQLLEKILLGHAASNFAAHPKLVDVVLLPADADIQNKYLNFITSVEDVFSDLPETPKGVIIEEITSLDESNKSISEDVKKTATVDNEKQISTTNDAEETLASISTSEDPLSINIEEVLGLSEEDEASRIKSNRLSVKLNTVNQLRSSSTSQDSPLSDERTRSPVTMMMQIGPNKSVDEKSEENPT